MLIYRYTLSQMSLEEKHEYLHSLMKTTCLHNFAMDFIAQHQNPLQIFSPVLTLALEIFDPSLDYI